MKRYTIILITAFDEKGKSGFIFLVSIILQRLKFFAKNMSYIKKSQKVLFDLNSFS